MAEFIGEKDKNVNIGGSVVFENKTNSSFEVSAGIVFHKSGLYEVSIIGNKTIVSKAMQRKKGKWIPVDSFSAFGGDEETWMAHGNPVAFHYCSECKNHAHADEFGKELLTDFCPECGADMRGEEE